MALYNSLSLFSYNYCYILLIFTSPLFSSPGLLCTNAFHQTRVEQEALQEEKIILGSTPPSCYNKCKQCHPCMAVQVPTMPSLHRVQPPFASQPSSSMAFIEYDSSSGYNNRYSNYKPLGWKCLCRDHHYNP